MKKIIPVVILLLIVGAGYFYSQNSQKEQEPQVSEEQETKPKVEPEVTEEMEKVKNEESSQCTYSIRMGGNNFEATAYIKGDKYKTVSYSGDSDNEKKFVIFDGENTYTWKEGEASGSKMSAKCAEELGAETNQEQESAEDNGSLNLEPSEIFENAQSANCFPVEDVDLSLPKNVEFTNQCELLKKQMEEIRNMR